MTDPAPTGLREQKRLATRRALQRALLEQSLARGFDAVTVEDVTGAAQVSPRTFFNYFESKEDAVALAHPPFDVPDDGQEAFLLGGSDVLTDLVALVARHAVDEDGFEIHALRKRLVRQDVRLLGMQVATVQRSHERVVEMVTGRLRADAARHGDPVDELALHDRAGLIVMVAVAITRHGWSRWVSAAGAESLERSILAGYAEFRALSADVAVPALR